MPNLDGLELFEKKIRNADIFYWSAYLNMHTKALRLGADDYILKPVKPRELVELVMKILQVF